MIYLQSQLKEIVSAGGSVVIDMNQQLFLFNQILELAEIASQSRAKITIKNPTLLTSQMTDIARAGDGSIIFEL